MTEPDKYLPLNRAELIARCEHLNTMVDDGSHWESVAASYRMERDALVAELAGVRADLAMCEAKCSSQVMRDRVAALVAALRGARDTLREIEPMVDHVYSRNRIRVSEKECVAALATLDDADEFTHKWRALLGCPVTDCGHGQIIQTGCPMCEKRLGRVGVEIDDSAAPAARKVESCNNYPPGKGYCDMCAAGQYEKCRYLTASEGE